MLPRGAVARGERPAVLVFPARGDEGEISRVGGDAGDDPWQKGEEGVGPPVLNCPVDGERRGAAARGVLGGKGQAAGQMGCRGGGEQVDRMGAPDRIEFLEGGASQCPVGRWWVIGELCEEGGCPKGTESLLVSSFWGLPADIDAHGARLFGVLLDRGAYPIELLRARGEDYRRHGEGVVG